MFSRWCQCFGAEDETHGTHLPLSLLTSDRNDPLVAAWNQTKSLYWCLSLDLCPEITLTCFSSHPSVAKPSQFEGTLSCFDLEVNTVTEENVSVNATQFSQ